MFLSACGTMKENLAPVFSVAHEITTGVAECLEISFSLFQESSFLTLHPFFVIDLAEF